MTGQTFDALITRAREAAQRAYAPYSGFSVGCAIESVDGQIVVGSNMENACYRLGVCGEIAALTQASQAFGLDRVARIAVVGGALNAEGMLSGQTVVTPCGGCRQSIVEAAQISGRNIVVICADGDGGQTTISSISELLPHAFGPASLT